MHKLYIGIKCLVLIFISAQAHPFSSSSYLVANFAISFFDYEEAHIHYDQSNAQNLNITDLEKKLLAYVNTNSLNKASFVAEKILRIDKKNQEAWSVYLINAKLNNLEMPFNEFKKERQEEDLKIVEFIFFNNSQIKNDNRAIAQSIFEVVQTSMNDSSTSFRNYDYLLLYLSLCLNLNEEFDEVYYYIAKLYENLKKYEIARKFYDKINIKHPLYIESKKNIAINKRYENNLKAAEEDLISLINNNIGNENILIALADLYRSTKQYKKAILYYSKILNTNINEDLKSSLLFMRGICYERLNNWQSAEEDFLNSLEINKDSANTLNYLAYAWIERNMFLDRSLKMLNKAHDKSPDSHYILDSLAWAHYKKNNLLIASELMEEVIERAPGEAISIDHLGDIYFALGRKREANYMWKQAMDLAEPEDEIIESLTEKLQKKHD